MESIIEQSELPIDLEKVFSTNRKTIAILKVQHTALRQIADSDCGLDAGIASKAIAADALMQSEEIALSSDVEVAE